MYFKYRTIKTTSQEYFQVFPGVVNSTLKNSDCFKHSGICPAHFLTIWDVGTNKKQLQLYLEGKEMIFPTCTKDV